MRSGLLVCFIGLTASACLPAGTGGAGPDSPARQQFQVNVLPSVELKCSACHSSSGHGSGPKFLGATQALYYDSLVANPQLVNRINPQVSSFLLKGAHADGTAPAFARDEAQLVLQWLEREADEHPPAKTSEGSKTLQQALEQFAKCMSQSDWEAKGMDTLPIQTADGTPCYSCHSAGAGGAWLSVKPIVVGDMGAPANMMFEQTRQVPYLYKVVIGSVNFDGTFNDLIPSKRFVDKGIETGTHPKYGLIDTRVKAVDDFFNATYSKYRSGTCK